MPRPEPNARLTLGQPALLAAIRDLEAMGLWECLRGAGAPLSAQELATRASRALPAVHAALDLLSDAGLVVTRKARGRRRAVAYSVAVRELSIVVDSRDPEQRRIVNEVATFINDEMSGKLFAARQPIGASPQAGWHFHHCGPLVLDDSDLDELKRRIARVEEFVRLLADKHGGRNSARAARCNHGMVIRIEPLDGHVLPQPHVEFVSETTVRERATVRGVAHGSLTERERQVARALRDGLGRAEVAARLGISALTVGTMCKRIYGKLGIRRAAQLHDFAFE